MPNIVIARELKVAEHKELWLLPDRHPNPGLEINQQQNRYIKSGGKLSLKPDQNPEIFPNNFERLIGLGINSMHCPILNFPWKLPRQQP